MDLRPLLKETRGMGTSENLSNVWERDDYAYDSSYSHNESHSDEGWLKFELDFRVRVRVGMTRSQTE